MESFRQCIESRHHLSMAHRRIRSLRFCHRQHMEVHHPALARQGDPSPQTRASYPASYPGGEAQRKENGGKFPQMEAKIPLACLGQSLRRTRLRASSHSLSLIQRVGWCLIWCISSSKSVRSRIPLLNAWRSEQFLAEGFFICRGTQSLCSRILGHFS